MCLLERGGGRTLVISDPYIHVALVVNPPCRCVLSVGVLWSVFAFLLDMLNVLLLVEISWNLLLSDNFVCIYLFDCVVNNLNACL